MSSRMPAESWLRLAIELSALPGTADRLLDRHVDAGCGRCRECTQPGTGLPGASWPCVLHSLAGLALDVREAARPPGVHRDRSARPGVRP